MNIEAHNCINPEDLITNIKANIKKHGLQVIMIDSTDYLPSFAYSIGLWQKYNHPEIICFGLSNSLHHTIINEVAEIIKSGESIEVGKNYFDRIFDNSNAEFLTVDPNNLEDYFGTAINFYATNDFPALQLVWTDRNDKFPWEENFEDDFLYKQPLLDRNTAFKFLEPKNLTSFTTKQWLNDQKPILQVTHDDEGDWLFLTGDQAQEDIIIVALEQLVLRDNTLNEVFDLEYGEEAEREYIGSKWKRKKIEYNDED
ncbi:hypothetical protein ASE21_12150 [Flavobacterium sp. Root901]|uniref:DUF4262 domain-containing protein n=1 Tax=Flavobacterium sp. Root901 TaxID=1736605 RepID=UPI00070935E7|nr:DUF4262 domain-containing protein [Flavobacterium sp. Root901]KRD10448.1 hypothetical protein ASE21_12150 [Flavobacterium sp. Root901]